MKIEINQPHADYPYAQVSVGVNVDTDRPDLIDILTKNNLTLLGPWKFVIEKGTPIFIAPVLLEDQHVKPRKPAVRKSPPKRVRIKNQPG